MASGVEPTGKRWASFYVVVSSFFGDFTTGMMMLSIPLYASALGATPIEFGAIGGAHALIYAIAPFFAGHLIGRRRGLREVSLAMLSYSGIIFAYSLATAPTILLIARFLEGSIWAVLWPALEVSASNLHEDPEKGLRKYNIAWSMGAIVGPIVAGPLITFFSIKAAFYVASLAAFSSGILWLFLPHRAVTPRVEDNQRYPRLGLKEISEKIILSSPFLSSFILAITLTFFPPYASRLGMSAAEIGFIFFARGVTRTLAFVVVPFLGRRWDLESFLTISTIFYCFTPLLILTQERLVFYVCFPLLGIFSGIIYDLGLFKIVGKASKDIRGSMAGIFEGTMGLGFFVGPLSGGLVAGLDPSLPFILPSFLIIISLITLARNTWLIRRPEVRKEAVRP